MMDNTQLARASFDDIVFEGRNKAYGAYVLRRLYNKHLTRALLIGIAIFAVLVSFPIVARMFEGSRAEEDAKNLKVNELMEAPPLDKVVPPPPPPPPPEAPPPPPPKLSTIKFTPPVIKKDEEVVKEEDIPDQDELKDKVVATETVKGNTDEVDLSGLEGEGTAAVAEVVDTKVYTYVEQMPQFPGGNDAIVGAIQKAIKYPALALRNQVEGKVFVNFTVNPQGEVTDVKITKGIGAGCDEETMRAVKTLPRFAPGKQNGRAVSVSFTVPVTFAIK